MSFANAWGSSWGSSGSSGTVIVDSFQLELGVEETILVETQEFGVSLDIQEYVIEIEENLLENEDSSFSLSAEI